MVIYYIKKLMYLLKYVWLIFKKFIKASNEKYKIGDGQFPKTVVTSTRIGAKATAIHRIAEPETVKMVSLFHGNVSSW